MFFLLFLSSLLWGCSARHLVVSQDVCVALTPTHALTIPHPSSLIPHPQTRSPTGPTGPAAKPPNRQTAKAQATVHHQKPDSKRSASGKEAPGKGGEKAARAGHEGRQDTVGNRIAATSRQSQEQVLNDELGRDAPRLCATLRDSARRGRRDSTADMMAIRTNAPMAWIMERIITMIMHADACESRRGAISRVDGR